MDAITRPPAPVNEPNLHYAPGSPERAAIEAELDQLLRTWFNHGFLVCRRIDAQTPPEILEKLVQYEAVHKIRDRRDLLRRLESDRLRAN